MNVCVYIAVCRDCVSHFSITVLCHCHRLSVGWGVLPLPKMAGPLMNFFLKYCLGRLYLMAHACYHVL